MGFPQNRHRLYVVTARIREAEGDLDGALDALREAELRQVPDFIPDVRPLSAQQARIWVRQRPGPGLVRRPLEVQHLREEHQTVPGR